MKKNNFCKCNIFYLFTVIIIFCNVQFIRSQVFIGAGTDLIKGFSISNPYYGFSLFAEKMENESSIYARYCSTLKQVEQIPTLIDQENFISGNLSYSYNTLELGRRNYGGNDLEFGLGYYLAEHVTISYNTVRINNLIDAPTDYVYPSTIPKNGNLLSFAIGGNAGVQYAFVRGIIYSEIGFNYSILGVLPNNYVASLSNSFSGINFTVNLGIKKRINFGY